MANHVYKFLDMELILPTERRLVIPGDLSAAAGRQTETRRYFETAWHWGFTYEPDVWGRNNGAGRLEAHKQDKGYGTAFQIEVPQHLGTLKADVSSTANAAVEAGESEVTLLVSSGSADSILPGRLIQFGADSFPYLVVSVTSNVVKINPPLFKDVKNGETVKVNDGLVRTNVVYRVDADHGRIVLGENGALFLPTVLLQTQRT